MDAVYPYRPSPFDCFELRYSLRSFEQYAPYIRKVWIYGAKGHRPSFISDDTSIIEYVPDENPARMIGIKSPVANYFLLMFLQSLIPDLSQEYLLLADDYFLLKDFPIEEAHKMRYLEDMSNIARGRGIWKDALWRTYDLLMLEKYTGYNFETHVPAYFKRQWVMDAYTDFKDFITEHRFYGPLGITAVLNHAYKAKNMPLVNIMEENSRVGFWGKPPATYDEVVQQAEGKTFLNFDDLAFGDVIRRYVTERFPNPSKYEKA